MSRRHQSWWSLYQPRENTGVTNLPGIPTKLTLPAMPPSSISSLLIPATQTTVGNGSVGFVKIGGSTISDNSGNLTLDSDSAAITFAADDTPSQPLV